MPHSGTHSTSEWKSHQRSIAQWIERPPPKRKVAGSNPVGTTEGTRRVQTIRVCAMDSWTVAMACDDTNRLSGWGRRRRMPIPPSQPMRVDPIGCTVWAGTWFRSSTWQSARNGRVDAGSKPARATARQRHPCRPGSPSSQPARERWRRGVLLYHSHRPASAHPLSTRRTSTSPARTSFHSFPGRRGSDGGGDGNINSPSEMPPACMRRPASLQAILVRCGPLLIARAVVVRPSTMPVPRLRAEVRPGCAGCDKETLCGKTGRLSLQQRAGRKNFHPAL